MEYTVGQLAEKMNISAHTLRYYDSEGLLRHVKRSASGRRVFTERDVVMLNTIECLKKVGMSLAEIRQYIDWCEEGFPTVRERYELFAQKEALVEAQIAELQAILSTLRWKREFYQNAMVKGTVEVCDSEREEFAEGILREKKMQKQARPGAAKDRFIARAEAARKR